MDKDYIQLKDNSLRFYIRDAEGNETGEYLEFNMGDLELLNVYEKMLKEDKANKTHLKNQLNIIEKKQDHKSRNALISDNERAEIEATQEFYKKEVEVYNMFLGENGVQKLLNGRPLSWTTLTEIEDIITKDIQPKIKISLNDMKEEIKKAYSIKESDVLKDEA